ncbi:MAG: hypothetical protein ACE5FG_13365 [Myxococcota bacterium]
MLFLHEVHEVVGSREDAFEAAYRDELLPTLARDDEARLLYYLVHAHGTGVSYNVVTILALRDGATWERLARRVDHGDLRDWAERLDGLRHDTHAKILIPLPWSPLQKLDLQDVPTVPGDHELSVFMEDTVWPYEGKLAAYIERSGSHYAREMAEVSRRRPALLRIEASFRTAFGSHRRREIVLWQKVTEPRVLQALITREVPPEYKAPGTWMHDALEIRDRWESKLLRSTCWSPWF